MLRLVTRGRTSARHITHGGQLASAPRSQSVVSNNIGVVCVVGNMSSGADCGNQQD